MSTIEQLEEGRKTKRKEESGTFAFIVWLLSGIYLFYATVDAQFISWQALVYFVPGSFAASLLIGGLAYALTEAISHACMARWLPNPAKFMLAGLGGIFMLAFSTVGGFWISRLAFSALHGHSTFSGQ